MTVHDDVGVGLCILILNLLEVRFEVLVACHLLLLYVLGLVLLALEVLVVVKAAIRLLLIHLKPVLLLLVEGLLHVLLRVEVNLLRGHFLNSIRLVHVVILMVVRKLVEVRRVC